MNDLIEISRNIRFFTGHSCSKIISRLFRIMKKTNTEILEIPGKIKTIKENDRNY